MDTFAKLNELFKSELAEFSDFPEITTHLATFKCKSKIICNVNLLKETCCTPYYGDEKSDIMLIAESPSSIYGVGFYLGGYSRNIKSNKKNDNLEELLKFIVGINGGKYSRFTDIVKCGMEKSKLKEQLAIRKQPCMNLYLIREIEIVCPKHIICIGNDSYNEVLKLQQLKKIDTQIKITKLHHYSNRASLTLSIHDKREVIWPLQNGIFEDRSEAEKAILNLDYVKQLLEIKFGKCDPSTGAE